MAAAALLSLEEFRDTQRRAVRQRLHDRFDHWLYQLEDRMQDRTPRRGSPPELARHGRRDVGR